MGNEMDYVYKVLQKEEEKINEMIQVDLETQKKAELIGKKNLIQYSISLLKKCDLYDIKPRSVFWRLPERLCESPSSEYRILEDCETEKREHWHEVLFDGKRIRLRHNDIIIET